MSRLFLPVADDLSLRELQDEDAPAYFALVEKNRAMLDHWQPGQAFTSIAGVRSFLQPPPYAGNPLHLNLGIWYAGRLAGFLQLYDLRADHEAGLGYWLDAGLQGRGLLHRCARALIRYAFTELDYLCIVIDTAETNVRSQAVARRLRFDLEKIVPPEKWGRRPGDPGQCIFVLPYAAWANQEEE